MVYGNLNRQFGWAWLAIFLTLGLVIELRLVTDPNYAANFAGTEGLALERELLRSAHAHGAILALLNLHYGLYIDKAMLGNGVKRAGSILAVAGAILLPLGLLGIVFIAEPFGAISMLGGISLIISAAIQAVGHFKQPTM